MNLMEQVPWANRRERCSLSSSKLKCQMRWQDMKAKLLGRPCCSPVEAVHCSEWV